MAQETSKKRKASSSSSSSSHGKKASSTKASSSASAANNSNNSNANSSATPKSQTKRALKQERQSHRKHADIVIEAKQLWNQLRLKSNSKEQVQQLTTQLAGLLRGKTFEIALQHDASRVVQAVLQFGTNEEREQILQELCSHSHTGSGNGSKSSSSSSMTFAELAKNQYAHFVVLKSIKYGVHSPECVRMVVKAFKGHIPKLAVHATGSKIVEALFQTFPTKSTAALKQEFYGPHFALFASDLLHQPQQKQTTDKTTTNKESTTTTVTTVTVPDLSYHLKETPGKKEVTLTFVRSILNKGIEKSLFGYTYYQELFAEYVANCSPNDVRDIAPSVVDHSIHLLSSKAGTRVVAACASYGTAKDRKHIMRSLKGFAKSALLHRDAYLALLRLVQLTDDTVSTNKNIFQELLSGPESDAQKKKKKKKGDEEEEIDEEADNNTPTLLELALNDRACKLFLMLLVTNDLSWKKLFDPYELAVMEDKNPTILEGQQAVPTSRKDPDTRREELLQHLQKPLMEICKNHTKELMFSLSGSALLREIYHSFHPKSLVDAVVEVCVSELDKNAKTREGGEEDNDNDDNENSDDAPLFEDRIGHLAIKNLILCDVDENDNSSQKQNACLAKAFFEKLKDRLLEVAKSNRGAFVLSALCKVPEVRKDAVKILRKKAAKLKQLAEKSAASAGYEALLKEIDGK